MKALFIPTDDSNTEYSKPVEMDNLPPLTENDYEDQGWQCSSTGDNHKHINIVYLQKLILKPMCVYLTNNIICSVT